LAEHQDKLSTRFTEIADVVSEADYWAGKANREVVTGDDVVRAIDERVYRSNLVEERIQSVIEEGTILIDTSGEVVGQVNGISVYDLGDYRFGRPSRITARVSLGRGQVVNIEREIQMSGRLHSKGFVTLNGYLHGTYGRERQLSLSASIGFEQTYDEVDGDSASSAELYALLSALSEVPIKQGIAVTGSRFGQPARTGPGNRGCQREDRRVLCRLPVEGACGRAGSDHSAREREAPHAASQRARCRSRWEVPRLGCLER
jgi:predicted ATP-dependent protease